MPSEASVKFFDETFFQKSFDLALDLSGRQPEKKLGKQRSVFPGRRSASAVNSRLGAVSYAHACANHRCTCAPGAGCPLRPPLEGTSPKGGRRDLAFCKPLVSCLLGSPFGGAGTAAAVTERASSRDAVAARRLRGQLASAPHSSVSPRRRLYQRVAHALGGVTGKLGAKISAASGGTEDPRRGSST